MRQCSFDGCQRPYKAKGLCDAHYLQVNRGGVLRPLSREYGLVGCSFEGCTKPNKTKGLCGAHYAQSLRGHELRPLQRREPKTICELDYCNKPERHLGLCISHYEMQRLGKPLRPIKTQGVNVGLICSFPPCIKDAFCAGQCKRHYSLTRQYPNASISKLAELESDLHCEICTNEVTSLSEFRVDHDHSCCSGCNKCIRGRLCNGCNLGLGNFQDSIESMLSAIKYLETHAIKSIQ